MLSFFRSSPSGKRIPYASVLTDGILSSGFYQILLNWFAVIQSLLTRVGLLEASVVEINNEAYIFGVEFNTPGVVLPSGAQGETLYFRRATAAPFYVNGALVMAGIDQPRLTHEGLILEPGATNMIGTPEDLSQFTLFNCTRIVGGGPATPEGGHYTKLTMTVDVATTHGAYMPVADPGLVSSCSFYISKTFGGNARYVQVQDNSNTHRVRVDLVTGVIVAQSATHTVARCEDLGVEWRISVSVDEAIILGAIWVMLSNANPASPAPVCDGAVTDWIGVRRAQVVPLDFPTSWSAGTIAADNCWVAPRRQIPPEFRFEATAQPVDGNNYRGVTPCPIVSVGDYGGQNSICLSLSAGNVLFSVRDSANAEKLHTCSWLAAGSFYTGTRYWTASSSGYVRPSLFVDGRESNAAPSGAGTGLLQTLSPAQTRIRIGNSATSGESTGLVVGGVIVRRLGVFADQRPSTKVAGAYCYREAFTRGYVPDSQVVACIGDSITDAVLVDPTNIYESWTRVAARTKGLWMCHNFGVGSNGLEQIAIRWREHVKGHGYQTLVLQGGINNANIGQTAAEMWAITEPLLNEILLDGVTKLICFGLLPGNNAIGSALYVAKTGYNALLAAWCASHASVGALYYDAWASFTDGANPPKIQAAYDQATPGSFHLNQAGNNKAGAEIAALL